MRLSLKISLIVSIVLLSLGTLFFLAIGTPLHDFTIMWVGVGFFLAGIAAFIFFVFYRTYLKSKEKDKDEIKRG